MKRSEALTQLKILLADKPLDEMWLYYIMDAVEQIGMLPPSSIVALGDTYAMSDCTHVIKKGNDWVGAGRKNIWEPENE